MNIKLKIGKMIHQAINGLIRINPKLVPFIPNGRLIVLDVKRSGIKIQTIFDVGANEGQTSNFFIQHFPDADILCFEPVQSVYKQLLSNITNTRIKCFNQALGHEKGSAKIYKSETYNGIASINGVDKADRTTEETIAINTGEDICREHEIICIDLLKIDTEGYELKVLEGFKPMLKKQVKLIYAEVCFDRNNECQTYITDLLEYLTPYGFIPSGFYDSYRIGDKKLKLNHCDLLLVNTALVDV